MSLRGPLDETDPDQVDLILKQWKQERPDLDVSAMAIIGRISRLDKILRARLDTVFADHDLEAWEFDVLATLLRTGAPYQLTPGQLLDSMMITSGTMTNRIDRLEHRGFVERSRSDSDRRQVLVKLTKPGLKKVDAALIDHIANERNIVNALTPDQRHQLVGLLRLVARSAAAQ